MLKILQTGDLHLGKILYEYPLIEEQKHMLTSMLNEINSFDYDALLLTGDIYDRSVPSPEAIRLFDDFLTELHHLKPELVVCIISGNHDSQTRLSFGSSFFKSQNIHITTQAQDCTKPIFLPNDTKPTGVLYQIPFLHPGSLREKDGRLLKNQQELIDYAIKEILISHEKLMKSDPKYNTIPAFLNCHLFTLTASPSDSERLFLGTAEHIDASVFMPFAYTAIGHLHKHQKITDRAYYAGSPLAYSFSETHINKCFLRLEINTNPVTDTPDINITPIDIIPLRKLVHIENSFENFEKMSEYKDDFIEFTCTDTVIIENLAARLRKRFPFLLSVKQKSSEKSNFNNSVTMEKRKTLFEKKEALPITDILSTFLESVELLNEKEEGKQTSDWKESIDVFATIAQEVQQESHETN